ncbi:MAG: Gldg family protein [Verrucomicrobiota bacterium]|jgi:hypothetical protein
MKPSSANVSGNPDPGARTSGRGTAILLLVVFLLGVILAGVWFKYGKSAAGSFWPRRSLPGLSENAWEQLRHLNSPVEIRFYSVLPPGSAPEPLRDFSGRVDHLLSQFQDANASQIHVTRNISTSETSADAAAADGIRPFNLDKGEACFLGIAVAGGGRKETLARLQPEWEPALSFDLARAILQVAGAPSTPVVQASPPVSPETTNEILRLIPDVKGTSLEDGTRILREAALRAFTDAGAEMEKQIQAAQQQLVAAQNGGSGAEQQSAMKHLQQVQLDQAEKLKQLATQLQTRISVFEQMKAAPPATK